jgi:hypothetical protein
MKAMGAAHAARGTHALLGGGAVLAMTGAVIGNLAVTHSGPFSSPAATPTATTASARFSGTWLGTYTCSQGLTGLRLTVSNTAGDTLQATFAFFAVPSNPHVPSGSFSMTGHATGKTADLVHDHWITQTPGYVMVDLVGTLRGDGVLGGSVSSSGCGSFSVTKQAAE